MTERALVLEGGLIEVAAWEVEHGRLSDEEPAWAYSVLGRVTATRVEA